MNSTQYKIVAVLEDGQVFSNEEHVGEYARQRLSKAEAWAAINDLSSDRPEGHEDVTYEMHPV